MTKKGTLQRLLNNSEQQLWNDFNNAAEFDQRSDIGAARELPLKQFLSEHLPRRYSVGSGEVVDYLGHQTGQLDLIIYDGASTCPLMNLDNGDVLLPAEALLATIEVKTTLTEPELSKAIKGISAVHNLRPWGKAWHGSRLDGEHAIDRQPRVFTSVFAYKSLTADRWASKEIFRLEKILAIHKLKPQCVDRLAVLDRGLIIPQTRRAAQPGEQGVLGLWFFSLINFLDREVARRKEFPWARYEAKRSATWKII